MDAMESFFNSNFTDESQESCGKQKNRRNMNHSSNNSNDKPPPLIEKKLPEEKKEKEKDTVSSTETKDSEQAKQPVKKVLLDPLSVIVKLAIISNKPVGTKILIKENIIHIQEPGPFQGLTRYINNTNRNDLKYLYNPIQVACKKYIDKNKVKIPEIIELFICAQNGIAKLIETYQSNDVISICLNYYHSIIQNYTKHLYNPIFRDDELTPFYNDMLLSKLNDLWSQEKIKMILDMIKFLNDDKMASENVKSLDIFIQNMDKHTQPILNF